MPVNLIELPAIVSSSVVGRQRMNWLWVIILKYSAELNRIPIRFSSSGMHCPVCAAARMDSSSGRSAQYDVGEKHQLGCGNCSLQTKVFSDLSAVIIKLDWHLVETHLCHATLKLAWCCYRLVESRVNHRVHRLGNLDLKWNLTIDEGVNKVLFTLRHPYYISGYVTYYVKHRTLNL